MPKRPGEAKADTGIRLVDVQDGFAEKFTIYEIACTTIDF